MTPKEKALKWLCVFEKELLDNLNGDSLDAYYEEDISKAIDIALKEIHDRATSPEWGDKEFREWCRDALSEDTITKKRTGGN